MIIKFYFVKKRFLELLLKDVSFRPWCVSATAVNQTTGHTGHVPYGWIIGGSGAGFVLLAAFAFMFVCVRLSVAKPQGRGDKDPEENIPHKFQVLRTTSFCCGSGRYICCKSADWRQTNGESSDRQMNIPKGDLKFHFSIDFKLYTF